MSVSRTEQYLHGWFRSEYRGELLPDESQTPHGSAFALTLTRGAELRQAQPTTAYLVPELLDASTFHAEGVARVRVVSADSAQAARLSPLLNVVVKPVRLTEIARRDGAVYGILEGEAWATVPAADYVVPTAPLIAPPPARGIFRLGCLLPLLTLGFGCCLATSSWLHPSNWLPSGGGGINTGVTEDLLPSDNDVAQHDADLDIDFDGPEEQPDSLQRREAKPPKPGQPPAGSIPVTGRLLSVALSDWNRADGDRVTLRLNGQPVATNLLLRNQPQSYLLRTLVPGQLNELTLETVSQGNLGVASMRVELNDGVHPDRRYELRGRLGRPLTLRLRVQDTGSPATTDSVTLVSADSTAVVSAP
jgi:hypothetical protein